MKKLARKLAKGEDIDEEFRTSVATTRAVTSPSRRISTPEAVMDGAARMLEPVLASGRTRRMEPVLATGRSLVSGRNLEAILSSIPTGPIPMAALVDREAFRRQRTSQGSFEKKADRLMRIFGLRTD